jgi:hypothetical protein
VGAEISFTLRLPRSDIVTYVKFLWTGQRVFIAFFIKVNLDYKTKYRGENRIDGTRDYTAFTCDPAAPTEF